jgi:hypothetical protein
MCVNQFVSPISCVLEDLEGGGFVFLADCGALPAVGGGDGEAELPPGKRL